MTKSTKQLTPDDEFLVFWDKRTDYFSDAEGIMIYRGAWSDWENKDNGSIEEDEDREAFESGVKELLRLDSEALLKILSELWKAA
jgi:hypothetical protein